MLGFNAIATRSKTNVPDHARAYRVGQVQTRRRRNARIAELHIVLNVMVPLKQRPESGRGPDAGRPSMHKPVAEELAIDLGARHSPANPYPIAAAPSRSLERNGGVVRHTGGQWRC